LAPDLHNPPLNEGDTRAKLIDSAIHERGWTVDYPFGILMRRIKN
jgi:type I site-specific restriction endonuclease